MKEWRTAVVGAGLMGTWHGVYARRAGARVVAVVDREKDVAQALAARLGGHAYTEDDPWLAKSGAQVVHICTPLSSHFALAAKCLEVGCHVVVEKPLASTFEQTEQLLASAKQHECRLIAVHQMPFQRGVQRLLNRRAELGEFVRIEHRAYTAGAQGRPPAARREVLHSILPHSLSLFHALGCAVSSAGEWRILLDGADGLELSAALGRTQLTVSFSAAARPTRNELLVWGTKGSAQVDLFHGLCIFESGRVSRVDKILRPVRFATKLLATTTFNLAARALDRQPAYPGLLELFKAFYASLEGKGPPPVREEEVLAAADLRRRLLVETP